MTSKAHGHTTHSSQSPTYVSYHNMKSRCLNPASNKYAAYGAQGIGVCNRWLESFQNFLDDMGSRPPGATLDRINGRLGYSKENCRWADIKTQQGNIRTNLNIEFAGKRQNVAEWAREKGLDSCNLAWRLRSGWSVEAALTTPPRLGNRLKTTKQVIIEHDGRKQCLSHWAKEFNLSNALLRLRLSKGWSVTAALTTPKGVWNTKRIQEPTPERQTSFSA